MSFNFENPGIKDYIFEECFGLEKATMIFRYANYNGQDTSERGDLSLFPDNEKVQEFAVEALKWCAAKEIITGKGEEKALVPQGSTNRAECATIISRYTDNVE